MKLSALKSLKQNRSLRVIGWILSTILLGALGSGLWDRVLSSVVTRTAVVLLSLLSRLSHSYTDILHKDIGNAQTDQLLRLPYLLAVTFIILAPWLVIYFLTQGVKQSADTNNKVEPTNQGYKIEPRKEPQRTLRKQRWLLTPVAVVFSLYVAIIFLSDGYTRNASIFVERSIDILAPHISTERILELKAKYRSIDNAEKFYRLEAELRSIAAEKNVELPDFTVIR